MSGVPQLCAHAPAQQIWPAEQLWLPQTHCPPMQLEPLPQARPQAPQLLASFIKFLQPTPLQHE
jgi:hypothetical protein